MNTIILNIIAYLINAGESPVRIYNYLRRFGGFGDQEVSEAMKAFGLM